jgi:hypothetical protein
MKSKKQKRMSQTYKCVVCLLPENLGNRLDMAWDGQNIVHEKCRICQLCGKPNDVQKWAIEEADGIPYAHLTCLQKIYCKEHSQYYPCPK